MDHLNSQNADINFTTEHKGDNRLGILDTAILRLCSDIDTDQCFEPSVSPPLNQKVGVVSTFKHRCDTFITIEETSVLNVTG